MPALNLADPLSLLALSRCRLSACLEAALRETPAALGQCRAEGARGSAPRRTTRRSAGKRRPAEHADARGRNSPVARLPRRLRSLCSRTCGSPLPVRLRLTDSVTSQRLVAAPASGYRVGGRVSGVRSREALAGVSPRQCAREYWEQTSPSAQVIA